MIQRRSLSAVFVVSCLALPALGAPAPDSPASGAPVNRAPAPPPAPDAPELPLSVDAAVQAALRGSPTLEIARHELSVGLLEADKGRPAFRPEVTASASQILRTPRVDLPGRVDDVVLPNSQSRFEIGVKQPLYQFGIGNAPTARANALAAAARSEYRKAEQDTVLEAREACLGLARAQALAEVATRGLTLARENVRVTKLLVDTGYQAEVDLLEAQRAEADAESGVLQAQNGIALARANLNRVLGRAVDMPVVLVMEDPLPPEPEALSMLVERAVRQRPEVRTLRHNMEAAEAGIKLAKSQGLPRVSAEAAYAFQTETALIPKSGFAAGLTITAPLFSGAANRYTIREAEIRLQQLKSALKAREQGIALEVERQRLAMQEARSRRAVAEKAIAAAEKVYEITGFRLEKGQAIQVEVLNARLQLQKALSDRAAAENDLRVAQARLYRATGETIPGMVGE